MRSLLDDQESELVRTLKGHSGAVIELRKEPSGSIFVRKKSSLGGDSKRLRRQYEKLLNAEKLGVSAPAVLREEASADYFAFDMQYVSGITASELVKASSHAFIYKFVDYVKGVLAAFRERASAPIASVVFRDKIASVEKNALANATVTKFHSDIAGIATFLQSQDWTGMRFSENHGDFTLENIICTSQDGAGFVLIDFDETDLGSYFTDIGKLHQDLLGEWCLRDLVVAGDLSGITNARATLRLLYREIAHMLAAEFPECAPFIRQLTVLSLFRILPYARDAKIAEFVILQIMEVQGV